MGEQKFRIWSCWSIWNDCGNGAIREDIVKCIRKLTDSVWIHKSTTSLRRDNECLRGEICGEGGSSCGIIADARVHPRSAITMPQRIQNHFLECALVNVLHGGLLPYMRDPSTSCRYDNDRGAAVQAM